MSPLQKRGWLTHTIKCFTQAGSHNSRQHRRVSAMMRLNLTKHVVPLESVERCPWYLYVFYLLSSMTYNSHGHDVVLMFHHKKDTHQKTAPIYYQYEEEYPSYVGLA